MNPQLTVAKLKQRFADVMFDLVEFRGATTVFVPRERIVDVCQFLRDDDELRFNFLSDLCAVDLLGIEEIDFDHPLDAPRFEVVYQLYSLEHFNYVTLKVRVPEDDLHVPTVTSVWGTANWHERETFDMMGITFDGHPDLRRILTPEETFDEKTQRWKPFEGHPLRRDFSLDDEPVDFTVQWFDRSERPTN